jgi:hypothetical protein
MVKISNSIIIFLFVLIMSCILGMTSFKKSNKPKIDFRDGPGQCSSTCSVSDKEHFDSSVSTNSCSMDIKSKKKKKVEHFGRDHVEKLHSKSDKDFIQDMRRPDIPDPKTLNYPRFSDKTPAEKHFEKECKLDHISDKCKRRRIADKYNLNKISGGQGMYVNIDGEELINNYELQKKWANDRAKYDKKRSRIGCASSKDYAVYNMPECSLDKNKIEHSDDLADSTRVARSFKIHCNDKRYCDNDYYNRLMKKKNMQRIAKKKRIQANMDEQRQIYFNLNGKDYKSAEEYYRLNYGYDITPLNTTEWYLPSNYVNYSEYNRPKLDKVIINDTIPPNDKYRTRASNWHFGKPLDE